MIYDDLEPNDILTHKEIIDILNDHQQGPDDFREFYVKHDVKKHYKVITIANFLGY